MQPGLCAWFGTKRSAVQVCPPRPLSLQEFRPVLLSGCQCTTSECVPFHAYVSTRALNGLMGLTPNRQPAYLLSLLIVRYGELAIRTDTEFVASWFL